MEERFEAERSLLPPRLLHMMLILVREVCCRSCYLPWGWCRMQGGSLDSSRR